MKQNNFFICLSFILLLSSCHDNKQNKNIKSFKLTDFNETITMQGEEIPLKDCLLIKPMCYSIFRDSLLVIENYQIPGAQIQIINLNTGNQIRKFAVRGKGHGEYLGITLYDRLVDNQIVAWDVTKSNVTLFDIDSLISNPKYKPEQFKYPYTVVKALPEKNGSFFCNNMYYMRFAGYNKTIDRFLRFNIKNKDFPKFNEKKLTFVANDNQCDVQYNQHHDTIFVSYKEQDIIEMYNRKKLSYIGTLKGPSYFHMEYVIENGSIRNQEGNFNAYSESYSTEKYVYFLFNPETEYSSKKPYNSKIFKLTWSGQLKTVYNLDKYIYTLSVSSNDSVIYGTSCRSYKETPKLVKFNIPK